MSEEQHHEEHQDSNNLLDWLSLSFHNDAGDGHMECFSDLDYPDFPIDINWLPLGNLAQKAKLVLLSVKIEGTYYTTIPTVFQFRDKPISTFYLSDAPLRAPPFCA